MSTAFTVPSGSCTGALRRTAAHCGAIVVLCAFTASPAAWSQVDALPHAGSASLPRAGDSRVMDFNQRLYGDRNYTTDPAFRAGELATVDLPSLQLALQMPNVSSWTDVDLPFLEKGSAEDALVHAGPFKLDADRVVGSLVITDNAELTHHGRDAAIESVVGIQGIRAIWKLSDTTQVALEGDLIMLPFEGDMGFSGFGLPRDTLAMALGADSSMAPFGNFSGFRGEVSTGFDLGGWDVVIRDSFGIRDFRIRQDLDTYLEEELTMLELGINPGLEGSRFEGLDEAGYDRIYGGPSSMGLGGGTMGEPGSEIDRRQTWDGTSRHTRYDNQYDDKDTNLDFTNNLSVTISREAEASIRPVVNVFRRDSNYWYASTKEEEPRPDWYEGATLGLAVDRPAMRFPPYVTYTFVRDSDDPNWDRTMRVGFAGPGRMTDYIYAMGNVGLHTRSEHDQEDEQETIYELYLSHQPRPATMHSIDLVRYVEEPDDRLRKQVTYRLHQGLGSRLGASFAASRSELDRDGFDEEEWGVGGSLHYTQRTFALAWRSYYEQEWDEDVGKEDPDWKHQVEARVRLGSKVQARYEYTWEDQGEEQDHDFTVDTELYRHRGMFRIAYRFRWNDAPESEGSYVQNLLVLTAIRDLKGWSVGQLFGRDPKVGDAP